MIDAVSRLVLPRDDFEVATALSRVEQLARLRQVVGPPLSFTDFYKRRWQPGFESGAPPFYGKETPAGFEFYRYVSYRNSFNPRVSVEVGEASVRVRQRLHPLVAAFMGMWILSLGSIGGVMMAAVTMEKGFQGFSLVPGAMLVFGCLLPRFGFRLVAGKNRRDLTALFVA